MSFDYALSKPCIYVNTIAMTHQNNMYKMIYASFSLQLIHKSALRESVRKL